MSPLSDDELSSSKRGEECDAAAGAGTHAPRVAHVSSESFQTIQLAPDAAPACFLSSAHGSLRGTAVGPDWGRLRPQLSAAGRPPSDPPRRSARTPRGDCLSELSGGAAIVQPASRQSHVQRISTGNANQTPRDQERPK